MNRIAAFIVERYRLAWGVFLLATLLAALMATWLARDWNEDERLSRLKTEASRRGIELMSLTLNGNLMGSISLLGLVNREMKAEARGGASPNAAPVFDVLESVGRSFDADGVFLVRESGMVGSSWDSSGKPSTGINVKFRPYYQMSMQGMENVYAAVSLARGDRSLYFAAPIFSGTTNGTDSLGSVVARTGLHKVDDLLKGSADVALLLSPQGVVFAGNRAEWVGFLDGEPTPERMKAIRDLKQFGNMFENRTPESLPVVVREGVQEFGGRRYAVTFSSVRWNDPFGDWRLVLMEDLSHSVPWLRNAQAGAAVALALWLFGYMLLRVLQGHHQQILAGRQIESYAHSQERQAGRKSQLALVAMLLQQAKSIEELAQVFLVEANRQLGALQGTVYVLDPDSRRLQLSASYACGQDAPATLEVGEGLLGQCAADGQMRVIEAPEGGFWNIRSGLGETRPDALLMAPLMRQSALLGVVELAVLGAGDEERREQLEDMLSLLAMNLEIISRNMNAETMLAEKSAAERELGRLADIEQFNRLAQDREQRILELKTEVNALAAQSGQEQPYQTGSSNGATEPVAPEQAGRKLSLSELVDLDELQKLFSSFCDSIGIPAAIIDLEGKVLASSRWQRACTDFHRVNPASCARCIESDTDLALRLSDGADFTMYKCKNGMTDCASPIIVEGQHLANVFIGQFHLEAPDEAFFASQAKQFGYPEDDYLRAVREAPVMDEKRLPVILGFLSGFARMVTSMSLARYRADEAQVRLQRERMAAMSLAEDAESARRTLEWNLRESKQ
jgi:ligand-binding sensor protein